MKLTHVHAVMDTGAWHASMIVPAGHPRHALTTVFATRPRDCVHVTPTGAETATAPRARLVGMARIVQSSSKIETTTPRRPLDMVTS